MPVPHSHPAPGLENHLAFGLWLFFPQDPTLLPGLQGLRTKTKRAHNQKVEKGAVGHLAPAAIQTSWAPGTRTIGLFSGNGRRASEV